MANTYSYNKLEVVAQRQEDAGYLELGAVVDGVFVSFAAHKLPDFDAKVAEAKEAAAAAKSRTSKG